MTGSGDAPLADRYDLWVDLYKAGAVADVTLKKYRMTGVWLRELAKELTVHELDRPRYQGILNEYAKTHEKVTTLDFHRQVRCFVKDLIHDGEIEKEIGMTKVRAEVTIIEALKKAYWLDIRTLEDARITFEGVLGGVTGAKSSKETA